MPDFHTVVDVQTIAAFTDAAAEIDFGFQADAQRFINESAADEIDISFDGENLFKRLGIVGAVDATLNLDRHRRSKVYVRRVGAPGVATNIEIIAMTEA